MENEFGAGVRQINLAELLAQQERRKYFQRARDRAADMVNNEDEFVVFVYEGGKRANQEAAAG